MTLILNNDDVRNLLTLADCIEVLEIAYVELAEGRGAFRRRSDIVTPTPHHPDARYALKSMDGVVPKLGVGAIRLNSDILTFRERYGNVRRVKVPAAPNDRYVGLVLLFSTTTGEPLAIFPDGVVQPMRVAATTAIAAKHLAREDAVSVAIIGSGWQARHQLPAVTLVRNIRDIRCFSTNPDHREAYCAEMSVALGREVKRCTSAEAAVAGADIVLCATSSITTVAAPDWLAPGMHISSIKSAEIDAATARAADVVVTHVNDCDPVFITTHGIEVPETPGGANQNLAAEIGFSELPTLPEVVAGKVKGRAGASQVTCFLNTLGLGYQFAAVGSILHRKARDAGRGTEVPTDWFTEVETP